MNWMSRLLVIAAMAPTIGIADIIVEHEQTVPLDKLPKQVLEAAQKAMAGIKLTKAELEKTADKAAYEVMGTVDGKEYEIKVSSDGKVLESKPADTPIALDKVPKNVLEAAQKALPGIKITEAEVKHAGNGEIYEIIGTLDGKEYECEISPDGKVLEIEQEIQDVEKDKAGAEAAPAASAASPAPAARPDAGVKNAGAGLVPIQ